MDFDKKTTAILKKLRKTSKDLIKKEIYTEFFYLNRERKVIEFLKYKNQFILELFLKELLPEDFREFISFKLLNDEEEEIQTWYYEDELSVLVISVNWGLKKEEISIDLNINNFVVASIDSENIYERRINHNLFNDFMISYMKNIANDLNVKYQELIKV
jgi:hypothetical protein